MRGDIKTESTYFDYIGSLELPINVVDSCSQSGDVLPHVISAMEQPEIKLELEGLNPDNLVKELSEYGAWNEEELSNHSDNLQRILWIACCNIREERN